MPYLFQKKVTDQEIRRKTRASLGEELLDYLWYFIKVFAVVALCYVFIRENMTRSFVVEGASMAPNYTTSDQVFVNKIAPKIGDLKRGDVVVFSEPATTCPKNSPTSGCYLIKRIIGLPGETVYMENGSVYVINEQYKKGILLDESKYLPADTKTYADVSGKATITSFGTIPNGHYFVLGDNRTNSSDSRFSTIGSVSVEQIEGKEFYRPEKGFSTLPAYNISN